MDSNLITAILCSAASVFLVIMAIEHAPLDHEATIVFSMLFPMNFLMAIGNGLAYVDTRRNRK